MRDMTFIDNEWGINLNVAGKSETQKVKASNMFIYGEAAAKDCPDPSDSASCFPCRKKLGFMLFGGSENGKALHPQKQSSLPISKIKSYGAFAAEVEVDNVQFIDFADETRCGARQRVFERNPTAADYIPLHKFTNIKFQNVASDAMAWIEKPNPAWAADENDPHSSPDNCGNWPCTAPENVVLKFEGTTYASGSTGAADFQIVSGNAGAASSFQNCAE